jgi:hypothetical protein
MCALGATDGITFGADDFCGLSHVMSCAQLALALSRDLAGKNRQEIDDKSVSKTCFGKEVPELFNSVDPDDEFTHVDKTDPEIMDIDPNNRVRGRSELSLRPLGVGFVPWFPSFMSSGRNPDKTTQTTLRTSVTQTV